LQQRRKRMKDKSIAVKKGLKVEDKYTAPEKEWKQMYAAAEKGVRRIWSKERIEDEYESMKGLKTNLQHLRKSGRRICGN
jgi:hypothetical protein